MLKFLKETEKTAKSTDEAIELAMAELSADDIEEVNVEIMDEGNKGFLGLGSKEAKVLVSLKDPNATLAKKFLKSLFDSMKLDVTIDAKSTDDDTLNIELSGEHMGIIIGKRGDTLDSIQYLTSLVVNHENDNYIRVVIDTENYRQKREDALLKLANRLAHKVARSGKKYTLEPMNPYERRIIHAELHDNESVTTFSIGEDPYRKIVIAPKDSEVKKKPRDTKPKEATSSYADSEYAASYMDYKKTAPRHDVIKKAENFEAWQSAMEASEAADE